MDNGCTVLAATQGTYKREEGARIQAIIVVWVQGARGVLCRHARFPPNGWGGELPTVNFPNSHGIPPRPRWTKSCAARGGGGDRSKHLSQKMKLPGSTDLCFPSFSIGSRGSSYIIKENPKLFVITGVCFPSLHCFGRETNTKKRPKGTFERLRISEGRSLGGGQGSRAFARPRSNHRMGSEKR